MSPDWAADLETGNAAIDNDHREIFRRINSFEEACREGEGVNELTRLCEFVEEYVDRHFHLEEELMKAQAYPDRSTHTKLHAEFRDRFGVVKEELRAEGPGAHQAIVANYLLGKWWDEHISKTDKALAAFLKTKAPSS